MKAIDPGGWAPHLDPGERLLWEGAPSTATQVRAMDLVLVSLGLFLLATAMRNLLSSTPGVLTFNDRVVDPGSNEATLFFSAVAAVGFHLAIGRRLLGFRRRATTRYALTDRRALIATRFLSRQLRSYPITAETPVDFEPGSLSNIVFVSDLRPDGERDLMAERVAFERLPDGAAVMALVRSVQTGAAGAPP